MAIKRLRFNDKGEPEERSLDRSELPPPPPPKPAAATGARAIRASAVKDFDGDDDEIPKRSRVTSPARKVFPAGKTLLDEGVIRYACGQCGSTRIVQQAQQNIACSLCNKPMKLVSK